MSNVTNFLKLFKWDTKTDGSQKFNIDKALNENVDKIDTYLENLEIGGRNLLKNSKRELTNSNYEFASFNLAEVPKDGEEYTLSLKGTLGTGKQYFWIYNSYSLELTKLTYDNKNELYKSTFKWKSKSGSTTANNSKIIIYTYPNSVTNSNSSLEWVKLEKGNKATDWTPAPEDTDNAILALQQKIITTGTEFATTEYIDNKRVYRKRVNFGALPNASTKNVEHGLSNIRFVKAEGYATNANGTCIILPYANPTSANNVSLTLNSTNIQIATGTDRSAYFCYIDLYYTKN